MGMGNGKGKGKGKGNGALEGRADGKGSEADNA